MTSIASPALWVGFAVLVLAMLALDLGLLRKDSHEVGVREAAIWSAVWIGTAVAFNVVVYFTFGGARALEFTTAYLIEKALSVDNIFVFLVVFSTFAVPVRYHHRVLFWGILGALVMRGVFIAAGTTLLAHFSWIVYVFGAILVWSGVKLFRDNDDEIHPEQNPIVKAFQKVVPLTSGYRGASFFVREDGRVKATPLLVVLVALEASDIIFAVDSVPAVLAVSTDVFIVYTSNIFAILGLRSLYFVLSGVLRRFHLLRYGLSLVLVFVGLKMVGAKWYHVPISYSLAVIALLIGGAVAASLVWPPREEEEPAPEEGRSS